MKETINYDGRMFISAANTENGDVDGNTVFHYHQKGSDFSAEYTGGDVLNGYMIGFVQDNGELDFFYRHFNANQELRVGRCHSVPTFGADGRIELHEKWQWMNGDCSVGESVVVERR